MDRIGAATCLVLLILAWVDLGDTCSCMPSHPQEQFCNSDFVILARIKREHVVNGTREYKIRIRKEYKMSEKSYHALKYGRLLTAAEENMCGLKLEMGKVYAIGGKVVSLQARVGLCGFAEKWDDLTKRQRKGLKLMYRQGCTCKISISRCLPPKKCYRKKDTCNWETFNPNKKLDCQRNEGICLRSASKNCIWSKSASLAACSKNTTVMHYEPKPKKHQKVQTFNSPFRDGPGRKFGQ